MPADTHIFQVFFECTAPCLQPPLSSAVFIHPLHCCTGGPSICSRRMWPAIFSLMYGSNYGSSKCDHLDEWKEPIMVRIPTNANCGRPPEIKQDGIRDILRGLPSSEPCRSTGICRLSLLLLRPFPIWGRCIDMSFSSSPVVFLSLSLSPPISLSTPFYS